MTVRVTALLALAALCAGCSSSAITTTTPTTTVGTGTETFASFLAIGGTSVHEFFAAKVGTITVTLTIVTPAGVVGLGVGLPNASGPGCNLTNSLDASAAVVVNTATGETSPQLTIPGSIGTYCVEVYDSGQLADVGRAFSVTIVHQ